MAYEDALRPRTIVYDHGAIQAWQTNESPHYVTYATNELPHQTDQVHIWQDNGMGGAYIQYLGRRCNEFHCDDLYPL